MIKRYAALLVTALVLTACGFTMSEADRIARANEHIDSGDYRAANIELRNVLTSNPENLEARLMLANVSLALNDSESARNQMLRAAGLGASNAEIQELNIRILALDGQNLEVLAALAQEDSEIPELTALAYRGEALIALQNGEAALDNYSRWLEIEPDSPDAAVGYVKAMAVSGDLLEALARLEDIVVQHPEHAEAWQAMGMLRFRLGEYAASRDAYRLSQEYANPQEHIRQYLTTLLGLADAELMLRNADAARRVVNQLAAVAPASPQVLFQKARVAQLEQDYYAAADALRELLLVTPNDPRALMFLANVQNRLGATEQAVVLYRRVVALAPDNTEARKRLADLQLRMSNARAAVEVLAPLVGSSDEDPDVNRLLAMASFQQGNAMEAVARLENALASDPDSLARKVSLAEAYLQAGQPEKVAGLFTEEDLTNVVSSRLLMIAHAQQDDIEGAGRIAEALIVDHPDDAGALLAAAGYFRTIGNLQRAEELLNRSLSLDDRNVQTRIELAILAEQTGRADEAIGQYRAVIGIEPTNLPALLALGQDAERNGDREGALELLERARAAHPGNLAPRLLLASLHYNAGNFDDADTLAREMAAIGSDEPTINSVIANILIETGALEEALAVYEIAARQAPNSVPVLLGLSRAQVSLNLTSEARDTLAAALRIDPVNVVAVPAMALVEFRLGDLDSAQQRLADHISRNPSDVNGLVVSGDVHAANGDYDSAIAAFQAALDNGAGPNVVIKEYYAWRDAGRDPLSTLTSWLEAHPDDLVVRSQLAEHYQSVGDREAAMNEYEALVEAQDTNAVFLNNLAWEYQQAGNLDRALTLARRARELDPQSGPIADTLGWIHFERGSPQQGEPLLRQAVQQAPDDGEIAYHLAAVLAQNGKRTEAAEILRNLLESGREFPSSAAARELLATL